ncbi:MAG: Nif3-like dinuclear metal center hexameric protein, partial [bacterium]
MTYLSTLVQFLDQNLASSGYDDSSQNGLQVEASRQDIVKIGLAVDSGLSVLEKAVSAGCQMLIVHHGLFWKNSPNLSGVMGKKVRTLIEGNCSLYASHLPLDGHPELGNNAEIVRLLGAKLSTPFCYSGQKTIGYVGEFSEPIN